MPRGGASPISSSRPCTLNPMPSMASGTTPFVQVVVSSLRKDLLGDQFIGSFGLGQRGAAAPHAVEQKSGAGADQVLVVIDRSEKRRGNPDGLGRCLRRGVVTGCTRLVGDPVD